MAIFNNFPYVNTQELNLDYLIRKMEELLEQWRALSSNVTATAEEGAEAGVEVTGDLKNGLSFKFTLPADTLATLSAPGNVQPDGDTIGINGSGVISCNKGTTLQEGVLKPDGITINVNDGTISVPNGTNSAKGVVQADGNSVKASAGVISSNLQGTVARMDTGTNTITSGVWSKIPMSARINTFGEGALCSLTQGGVRVNRDGYYLIEGSSWAEASDTANATTVQLRVLKGTSYEEAVAIGWGVSNYCASTPINTAMRVIHLNANDIVFMDITITGSAGTFKYANSESQLTILKIA